MVELGSAVEATDAAAPARAVPDDFGADGGAEISNKSTVFAEIDRALGRDKPPALEYIYVAPAATLWIPFTNLGLYYNSYGHAAVRFNYKGEDMVMNITGKKIQARIVQWSTPEEFFYGTNYSGDVALVDQKGCYNRHMFGIRVEELPEENLERMYKYFKEVEQRNDASFNIAFGPALNVLRWVLPGLSESGNCARWTSEGLMRSGTILNPSIFPKSIFVHIFENAAHSAVRSNSNFNVVSYRRIRHANRSYGLDAMGIEAVAPLQTFRSLAYFNLEWFADAIVEVPENSTHASIRTIESPSQPSALRNTLNNFWIIGATSVVTYLVIRRNVRRLRWRLFRRPWQT